MQEPDKYGYSKTSRPAQKAHKTFICPLLIWQ